MKQGATGGLSLSNQIAFREFGAEVFLKGSDIKVEVFLGNNAIQGTTIQAKAEFRGVEDPPGANIVGVNPIDHGNIKEA